MWGLRSPALVDFEGGLPRVREVEPADRAVVEGFLVAGVAMPWMDLERRLWSGRLGEFLGDRALPDGPGAPEIDAFVRLLGFRRRAGRLFRRLDEIERTRLEDYASGVNAWIDQTRFPLHPAYDSVDTEPRLWGAADSLLIRLAAAEVDETEPGAPLLSAEAVSAGIPEDWAVRSAALWAALRGPELRGEGAVGAGASRRLGWPEGEALCRAGVPLDAEPVRVTRRARPTLKPRTILPGGDNHRVVEGEGWRRLSVQRPSVPLKGGSFRRPWLRRDRSGFLISDLLVRAEGAEAPTGTALAFEWPETDDEVRPSPRRWDRLPDRSPWRVLPDEPPPPTLPPLRLVPKDR